MQAIDARGRTQDPLQGQPRALPRTASASSAHSVPSTSNSTGTSVEQTASVDLLSYGSVIRPKTRRPYNASHFLVLGTDRLLLYTDVVEGMDRDREYGSAAYHTTGVTSSRPGTADSASSKLLAVAPSISLTASVGSVGELRLRGCSDDEESVFEERESSLLAGTTRCRVAVSINQLVDAVVINSNTLLVVYCPSTNKLNDPYSFKALTSSLSQSFRKRPEKMLREVLQQYSEDSYHFHVRLSSEEAAESMKLAVLEQARKFYECMVWLSKGFGVPKSLSSIVMLTTCGGKGFGAKTFGSRAFPELGEAVGLPLEVSEGMCGLARGEYAYGEKALIMTFYLETPVGMATVEVGLMDLERSWMDGSAPVEMSGRLRDADGDEEGEYCWEVTLTMKVTRGDAAIGRSVVGGEGNKGKDREEGSHPKTAVQRKQTHGLAAPLVVSLVALRAARGVLKGVGGKNSKNSNKKKSSSRKSKSSESSKISPTHLYEWSITTLGIDVSLAPRKPKAGGVARMVSTTHCLDDVNVCGFDNKSPNCGIQLPPAFETLMERHASIVTSDIATRFLVGLDSEAKAYTALIKMVEFWTKHDLSALRPNPHAFRSMKKHYPHGVIGWSKKSDCLITFEAMGKWPDAYKNVLQDGVSEDAILHHMLVCYLFNFQQLDDRVWPDGKAVKIMDLDGLRLGHINTAGFKFITSIANVLAIMFPQRMHQCIFINAPSFWNVAWSVMKNVVPEKVRNQMQVFNRGSKDKARVALLEYLDEDELHVLFPEPILENEYETQLIAYVERVGGSELA